MTLHTDSVQLRNVTPVIVNGKKLAVVATNSSYLPQYQREDNRYSVFVTGKALPAPAP